VVVKTRQDEGLISDLAEIFDNLRKIKIMINPEKLISQSQTALIPSRKIMEGVFMLHETIHELHRKKMNGFILKLDFERAYAKVNLDILQQPLRMKGFSQKWCHRIDQFVHEGSIGIKINIGMGIYFQTKKCLRVGDSLSPMIFNAVANMLALLISRD
jgi:hypothetical protein